MSTTLNITKNTTRMSGKPSYVNFEIEFLPDGASPTDMVMVIRPDDGDAFLEPVNVPGPTDNKVVWRCKRPFQIKFEQLQYPAGSLVPNRVLACLGKGGWNNAQRFGNDWWYTLILDNSGNSGLKETVAVKYSVKDVASNVEFDPVLIITH